jgi:agmatinase
MIGHPGFFADAETNYKDSKFVIFSVPYDGTSTYRKGSKNAPKKIREASWNYEKYDLITNVDFNELKVHDYGDLLIDQVDSKSVVNETKNFASKILKDHKFPILIGGEHSLTIGMIKSLPKKDTAVLVLDAHLDFRDDYENDKYNHACVNRRIIEHVGVENTAILGVRSAEKNELKKAKKQNLLFFNSLELKKQGLNSCLEKIYKKFKDKKIYLSIDMDFFDPAYAPGVGTPEPFGMSNYDFLEIIEKFKKQIIGFDIVEVNPKYDGGNITSFLAAKIIRFVIEEVSKK